MDGAVGAADIDFFTAYGHCGQRVTSVPHIDLVVVSTAWPYSKDEVPCAEDFRDIFTMIVEVCP